MLSKNEKTILEHVNERDCVASAYLLHVVPGRAWVEVSNIGCGYRKIALEGLLAERPIACMAGCLSEWPSQLLPRAALPPSPRTYLSFWATVPLSSTDVNCLCSELPLSSTTAGDYSSTCSLSHPMHHFCAWHISFPSYLLLQRFFLSVLFFGPPPLSPSLNQLSLSLSSSSATLLPCSAAYAAKLCLQPKEQSE